MKRTHHPGSPTVIIASFSLLAQSGHPRPRHQELIRPIDFFSAGKFAEAGRTLTRGSPLRDPKRLFSNPSFGAHRVAFPNRLDDAQKWLRKGDESLRPNDTDAKVMLAEAIFIRPTTSFQKARGRALKRRQREPATSWLLSSNPTLSVAILEKLQRARRLINCKATAQVRV